MTRTLTGPLPPSALEDGRPLGPEFLVVQAAVIAIKTTSLGQLLDRAGEDVRRIGRPPKC